MEVILIKPISFCFGVNQALKLVESVVKEHKDKQIYLFGELIHNSFVIEKLLKSGIKIVDFNKDNAFSLLEKFNHNDIVIFSAHGHDEAYDKILKKNNVVYYDSTCNIVKHNLENLKENKGKEIIFIGKENHPETLASLSCGDNVHLYDVNKGMDFGLIKADDPIIFNQTTLSFLELMHIFDDIKKHFPKAKFNDELCNASRLRQENILKINKPIDLALIVGDKNSSNTKKLYDVALTNKNVKKCALVSSLKEVEKIDYTGLKKVVISSGTSCPIELINQIKKFLEEK